MILEKMTNHETLESNTNGIAPLNIKEHFNSILQLVSKNQNHWTSSSSEAVQKNWDKKIIDDYLKDLSTAEQIRISQELYGYGPLQDLIMNEDIDEILIHGQKAISFEKKGKLFTYEDTFLSESSFQRIFEIISCDFFKAISYENPTGNGFWKGFRIHVIAPPLAKEIQISMRRIGGQKIRSLENLLERGFIKNKGLELIYKALNQRLNILISGATSSGKTTFIQCLMNYCMDDRFVILEDSEELYLPNSLSTALICPTRSEQYCINFGMKDLVKESLRMRPDRIVLGEARSDEAKDYIQALSTGHRGCIASIHASSTKDALIRLECLIAQGAPNWSTHVIKQLMGSGLNWVIHVEKNQSGFREIKKISEITSVEHTGLLLHDLYDTD
jgi:pilus assembly protein CpaF